MINIRNINNIVIIMLFAALHFGVAIVSRVLEYYDDILLTILTITRVIIVAMRNNVRVEIMAIMTMVVTLLGYVIGTWLQEPLMVILSNATLASAIATFLVTTTLGLTTDYITRKAERLQNRDINFTFSSAKIIGVALSILVLRLVYVLMDRAEIFSDGMLLDNIITITSNSWALLLILASNIAISRRLTPKRDVQQHHQRLQILKIAVFVVVISLLTTAIVYFDIPSLNHPLSGIEAFIRALSASLLIDLIVLTLCYIATLYIKSQRELREEREQKHLSQYRYERLKQQITPHFLFNSLGILDYLVQEHQTERASAFIHKFADIYRYMLNNDQKSLVKVADELEFTMKYIDLLKERFAEGMVFEICVEQQYMSDYVVPCSLQMLVENAAKHNIVSSEMPLRVSITTESNLLVVRNNLQPRTHGQPSTHLGLESIRQQYRDVANHDIIVEKSESEFIVKLPIV